MYKFKNLLKYIALAVLAILLYSSVDSVILEWASTSVSSKIDWVIVKLASSMSKKASVSVSLLVF